MLLRAVKMVERLERTGRAVGPLDPDDLGDRLLALAIAAVLLLVSFVTGAEPTAAQRRTGRVLAQIQREAARTGFASGPARGLA